jgi:putative ABC transport system substrate-binding protein
MAYGDRFMNRREMLGLVPAALLLGPEAVLAQPAPGKRRIGFLMGYPDGDAQARINVAAFREGLKRNGLEEGRNVQIDFRWAGVDAERARAFAKELIALKPDVIVASTNQVVSIVMQETKTIPVVFVYIGDPIGSRYAATLKQPGGNITGFANFEAPIAGKWLEILKEMSPATRRVGFVYHPAASPHVQFLEVAKASSPAFGVTLTPIAVTSRAEIESGITGFANAGPQGGIIVAPHALTLGSRQIITELAAQRRLPGVYGDRYFVQAGGLLSFGVNMADQLTRSAAYINAIFNGQKPGDLPVQLPTKYEVVINLAAVKALGLKFRPRCSPAPTR